MAQNDAFELQHSDLNGFLFADIGVESTGNTLSVLSALARMGMDPWQEGGRLAKLPRKAAIEALAQVISIMPASRWTMPDATTIAARLIPLLPAGPAPGATATPARGANAEGGQNWPVLIAWLAAMFVGIALNMASHAGPSPSGAPPSQAAPIRDNATPVPGADRPSTDHSRAAPSP